MKMRRGARLSCTRAVGRLGCTRQAGSGLPGVCDVGHGRNDRAGRFGRGDYLDLDFDLDLDWAFTIIAVVRSSVRGVYFRSFRVPQVLT